MKHLIYQIIQYFYTFYYTIEFIFNPIYTYILYIYKSIIEQYFNPIVKNIYVIKLNHQYECNDNKIHKIDKNFIKDLNNNIIELIICKSYLDNLYLLVDYHIDNDNYFCLLSLKLLVENRNYTNVIKYFNCPSKYLKENDLIKYRYRDKQFLECIVINKNSNEKYNITDFVNKLMGPIHLNDMIGHNYLNKEDKLYTLKNIWYIYNYYNKYNKSDRIYDIDIDIDNYICETKNFDMEDNTINSNQNVF